MGAVPRAEGPMNDQMALCGLEPPSAFVVCHSCARKGPTYQGDPLEAVRAAQRAAVGEGWALIGDLWRCSYCRAHARPVVNFIREAPKRCDPISTMRAPSGGRRRR